VNTTNSTTQNFFEDVYHLFAQPNAFRSILILIISLITAYWLSRFLAQAIIRIAQSVGSRSDNESDDARVMRLRQTETYLSIFIAVARTIVVVAVELVPVHK
jgi:galactitol-specific phosphotransferase system IIC component